MTNRSVALRGTFASSDATTYDVAPDGQRLLVTEPMSGGWVVFVVNWIEEFGRKRGS